MAFFEGVALRTLDEATAKAEYKELSELNENSTKEEIENTKEVKEETIKTEEKIKKNFTDYIFGESNITPKDKSRFQDNINVISRYKNEEKTIYHKDIELDKNLINEAENNLDVDRVPNYLKLIMSQYDTKEKALEFFKKENLSKEEDFLKKYEKEVYDLETLKEHQKKEKLKKIMIDFFVKNKIQKIKELFGMNIKPNPNNEKYFFISVPEIKSRGNKPGFFIVKSSDLEPAFFDLDGSMVNEPVLDGNNNITFKDFLKISEENTLKRSEGVSKAKVQKGTKVIKAETLEELLEMPSVIRVLNFLS